MKILSAKPANAKEMARIHCHNYKNAFLCDLGRRFLEAIYHWMLTSKKFLIFVVKDDGKIRGFISGAYDSSGMLSSFLIQEWSKIFFPLAWAAIKEPVNIVKIFETLFYSSKSDIGIKPELLSVAVEKDLRGTGVVEQLLTMFIKTLKRRGIRRRCTGKNPMYTGMILNDGEALIRLIG